MPSSTPFDSTVTIVWDVEQPVNALLSLHTQVSALDRALKDSSSSAGAWAIDFTRYIGMVHESFLMVIGDIKSMQAAMAASAEASPKTIMQSQVGAVTNYRLPDTATGGMPPPPGISQADWDWVQRQRAAGIAQGGISPTVAATSSWRMSLDQGFGQNWAGFSPADPMRDAQGNVIQMDQLQAAQRAIARQNYTQFQRIQAMSPMTLGDLRQQTVEQYNAANRSEYDDYAARAAQVQAAQRGLAQSEYEQGSRYFNLQERAGLTGSFDSNIEALRGQALQALPGVMDSQSNEARKQARADYEEDRQRILRVNQATKENTDANQQNDASLEKLGGSLLRHIGYIAQAVVIWGSFQAATQFIKQMITDVQQLESTSARLSYINPAASAGAQYAQAAQYGVGMQDAAAGILIGGQFGANAGQRNQAGQLAEIFGAKEYTNALQEIMQTQRRANDAGIEHVNIMGYIATAYKTVPGTMETYFDALQQGITLSTQLGLTAEQTGLMLQKAATTLEVSPEQVANVLERIQLRLEDPKVIQTLKAQFGISGTDSKDLMRQISSYVAGNQAGSEGLTDFLAKGLGIQGPRSLLEMTTALTEFDKAAKSAGQSLGNINDITSNIDKTGTQAFANLKAEADAFLATLIQIEAQKDPLKVVLDLLNPGKALGAGYSIAIGDANALSKALRQQADAQAYQAATGKSPYASDNPTGPREGPIKGAIDGWFMGILAGLLGPAIGGGVAGKVLNFINPNKDQGQYTPEYLAWLAQQNGTEGPGGAGTYDRGIDRSMYKGLPSPSATAASPFGGFQDLPKNFDWTKFQSDLKKYSTQLSKDVPDYVQNPQEVAFWDASKGYYRTVVADNQVIQRALQEQTDALKQITGVFNVPSSGEVLIPFFALQAGMVPSTDPRARGGAASRAQNVLSGNATSNNERMRQLGIDPNYHPGGALDPNQQAVMSYLKAHGFNPAAIGGAQSGRSASASLVDPRQEAIQQHREAMTPNIQVSLHNTVFLNSRIIYDEMVHQMQSQLSMARRGVGGGAGSQYTIG